MSRVESIEVTRDGAVAWITMTNEPRHTMTAAMVRQLDEAAAELETDASVRVIALCGGGEGIFVRHYEVGELADSADRARSAEGGAPAELAGPAEPSGARSDHGERPRRLHPYNRVMRRLEAMPKVTVAAVNGTAMGGGCELALACDLRIMAHGDYRFGLPETNVGIIPGAGGTQRLTRLLGVSRALDLILHGRTLTPEEALDLGLVHRLAPEERFGEEVAAFTADLAARAPVALAAAKRAIREGADLDLDDGLLLEQELFGRCMRTEDAAGALRASLRGERYRFAGR